MLSRLAVAVVLICALSYAAGPAALSAACKRNPVCSPFIY